MRSRASENWVWQSFVLGKGRLASWEDEWLVSGCLGNLKIFVVQRFAHFLVLCKIFWHKWMHKTLYIHLRDNLAWEDGNMLIIGTGCNVSLFSVWLICLRHLHFPANKLGTKISRTTKKEIEAAIIIYRFTVQWVTLGLLCLTIEDTLKSKYS